MRVFQFLTFIALIVVSAFFTLNLALGLGTTPVEKGALVAGSLILEGLKAYALVTANTAIRRHSWGRGMGYYLVYAVVASYSLVACLGYALSTVDRMEAITEVLDHDGISASERAAMTDYDEQISTLRVQIAQRQAAVVQLDPAMQAAQVAQIRKAITESLSRIDGYVDRRREAGARIEAWRAQDHAARGNSRRSLYELIGRAVGIPAPHIAFAILSLFALTIELGIFLTSPHAAAESASHQQKGISATGSHHEWHPITQLLDNLDSIVAAARSALVRVRERWPCRGPSPNPRARRRRC